jgi:putative oxidoreductase
MNDALNTPLAVAGRVLLALIFITSGFSKLGNLDGTAGYIASVGLPAGGALALGAGLLEVVAGLALAIGFKARWAALALGVFTIVAALLFHRYWAMPEQQQFMQQLLFMKNLAIAGGMFIVASLGAGAASIDARLARA